MPALSVAMVTSFWTFSAVGSVAVALRFYSRWKLLRKRPDWGDAFCALSMGFYITVAGLVSWAIANGYARHQWEVPKPPPAQLAHSSLIANTVNIQTFAYPKVALAFLLHELTRPPLLVTSFFYILAACAVIICLLQTIVQGITNFPHHVQGEIALATGTVCVIADLVYALYPTLVIWRSRIGKPQKIRISFMTGWGVVAAGIAVYKTVKIYRLPEVDRNYNVALIIQLQSIETFFLMLACTIPTLGPIVKLIGSSVGSFGNIFGRSRFTTALTSGNETSVGSQNREAQDLGNKDDGKNAHLSISVPREHAGILRDPGF